MGDVTVEFTSPAGERLAFDWPQDRLEQFDASPAEPIWELSGELDWDEIEAVRVLTARFEDGRCLALAAVHPVGAEGHGADAVAGVLVDEGEATSLAEALFSTEYGSDGEIRRIGLELYREEDGLPLRVAGDVTSVDQHADGGVVHRRIALDARAGSPGLGVLDVLTADG
ncbi:MAG: hypothetical protein ACJ75R_03665 [Solirubrobacterales bacterium]